MPPLWLNKDNNAFYENLTAEGLIQFTKKVGLDTACDVALLRPYWLKAQSILEVGAGTGRIIEYLLQQQYSGKITAIERCKTFFDYLQIQYSKTPNIALVHSDILAFKTTQKFDLILMMWSGIADFSTNEQQAIILKLSEFLNPNGALIIDTIPENIIPLTAQQQTEHTYFLSLNEQTKVFICLPTRTQIEAYAKAAHFHKVLVHPYLTTTGRHRLSYVLCQTVTKQTT